MEENQYKFEIDGLRGIAILGVVIFHINEKIMPSGFLGVDIFFVISGFLITQSLYKKNSNNFSNFLINFYKRRLVRVYPSLIIYVLLISFIFLILTPDYKWILRSGASSLLGLSNIFFWIRSTDYFADSVKLNPFTNTWSLGIETQFYIFFPVIFWLLSFRKKYNRNKNFFYFNLIFTLLSFCLYQYLNLTEPSAAYFLPFSRLWQLTSGSLLYLLKKESAIKIKFPSLFSFFSLLVTFFLPQTYLTIKSIFVVAASMHILYIDKENSILSKILSNKFLVHIGKLSYSIYLWHWGILTIGKWTVGMDWFFLAFQLFIIYFVSLLNYLFIETPFKKIKFFKQYLFSTSFLSLTISSITFYPFNILPSKLYQGERLNLKLEDLPKPANELQIKSSNLSNKLIYAIGDSHTFHLYPLFKKLRTEFDFSLYSHSWGGGILDRKINPRGPKFSLINRYEKMLFEVFAYYENKYKEGDLIFLSIHTLNRTNNKLSLNNEEQNTFRRILKISKNKNLKIIIVNQTPTFNKSLYQLCFPAWFRPKITIDENCLSESTKLLNKKAYKVNSFYKKLALDFDNVFVLDAFNVLCPSYEKRCKVRKNNGQFIFSDGSHLTPFGSKLLYEELKKIIIQNKLL